MRSFFKAIGWFLLLILALFVFYALPENWQKAAGFVMAVVFGGYVVREIVKDAVREAMLRDIDKLKERAYAAEESLKIIDRQNRQIIEWLYQAGYGPNRDL